MNFKTVLLGLVVALGLGVVVLVLWGDDSLDPAVERALGLPERLPLESNLFYPLAGFTVAEDKNPAGEGYAAVTRVNEVLHAHVRGERSAVQSFAAEQGQVYPARFRRRGGVDPLPLSP